MFRDLYISFGDTLQKGTLSTTVLTQETVPLSVVQTNLGTLNQQSAVEGQTVLVDLDISTLDVGNEHTVGGSVGGGGELGHGLLSGFYAEVLGGAVGGEVGHGCSSSRDIGGCGDTGRALGGRFGGLEEDQGKILLEDIGKSPERVLRTHLFCQSLLL